MRRIIIIFLLFLIANAAYLHRVPGLLGDEGSEGQNVYELLERDSITIVGERSYIGPIIDYVRVPFVAVFGYTPLALRSLMLVASIATFFLARSVLVRLFDEDVGTIALVVFLFSPIFLLQQRIGWAITLNVFFFWMLLYALMSNWKHTWLLSGLVGGVGLSNDIIFLPTLVAVFVCCGFVYIFSGNIREKLQTLIIHSWLIFVGFAAGFGTQAAVLTLMKDDQGSRRETVAGFATRLNDFLPSMPLYLSGSSYVARYTGVEFASSSIQVITGILVVLVFISLFHRKRIYIFACIAGLAMHSYILLYMVDRFTLRYFASLSMIVWMLAGVGVGVLAKRFFPGGLLQATPILLALILAIWTTSTALIPFLQTGGSLNEFSLGNRNDKASAFVDFRPLVSCIRGKGVMYGASQDIYDRLLYLSHADEQIQIVDGEHKSGARFTITYKKPGAAFARDEQSICPEIPFFSVVAR